MKRRAFLRFGAIAIVVTLGFALPRAAQGARFLSLGTASAAGTLYIVGAGLAHVVNVHVPGLRVVAEATAGSVENLNLTLRKKLDIGMSSTLAVLALQKKRDLSSLRIITMGHSGFFHWFVRKNSPIRSVEEIRGKRVGVGEPGSAHHVAALTVLKHGWGIGLADLKPAYLNIPATINALKDGTLDVGSIGSATPVAALIELSATVGIRFLPYPREAVGRISENSTFVPAVLKAGIYKGVDEDVPLVGYPPVVMYAHKDLEADIVYKVIKAIFEHPEERDAVHPQAKYYSREFVFRGTRAMKAVFPFHPGAERYLKEIGIWNKPDNAFARP